MTVPAAMKSFQEFDTGAYKGFMPLLGPRAEVIAQIAEICPEADFSDPPWGPDPSWAVIRGDGYQLEFNFGPGDPLNIIGVVPHGDVAYDFIHRICERTGWRAVDCNNGEFLDIVESWGNGPQQ